jgi:uncharacterized protein
MNERAGNQAAGPVEPKRRLRSVDAVRGFALFGVLLVNMFNFGAYSLEWTGLADRVAFGVMHSVFETKSWRLFSMLFAFGFALQLRKVTVNSGLPWFYIRRLVILFGIGTLHALIYDGDILMEYSMLGLILVLFRKVPVRALLVMAVLLMLVFPVGNLVVSLTRPAPFADDPTTLTLAERREGHPYLGSVTDIAKANAHAIPPHIWSGLHSPESSLAIFAMFLVGFAAGKSGVIENLRENIRHIRKVCYWGLGLGTAAAVVENILTTHLGYAVFREHSAAPAIQLLGDTLFSFGSTALALGYAAAIMMIVDSDRAHPVTGRLQYLGKMALTVYVSGSLMFGTLFYGVGFGQLFLLGPLATTLFAVLFYAALTVFCQFWLRRYRFGPLEWAWRSLTYGTPQPMRL